MLEHLTDPLDVLKRHQRLLGPGGVWLISLANVAIWNVRLALLMGQFEYGDPGTLDRTHMRFFTAAAFADFSTKLVWWSAAENHARDTTADGATDETNVSAGSSGTRNFSANRLLIHHGFGALPLLHAVALSGGAPDLQPVAGIPRLSIRGSGCARAACPLLSAGSEDSVPADLAALGNSSANR